MVHILRQPDSNSDTALKVSDGSLIGSGVFIANASIEPQEVYGDPGAPIRLRIANGGAGQSGFIRAWAIAFIKYYRDTKNEDIRVAWYLGDNTESLAFLAAKQVDVAVTYNEAAEEEACREGTAVRRVYGFDDHFYLVGPTSDPAHLKNYGTDVYAMFNQIVAQGNKDLVNPPSDGGDVVRFLSRFDKSATNIKESGLFCAIGQVPWALAYSKWYHQYPRFPIQALWAASVLHEYTLTDRGTWLSSDPKVRSDLCIFASGEDIKVLLNPAHVLLGDNTANVKVAEVFLDWVKLPNGGQEVVEDYEKGGQQLYAPAPTDQDLCCPCK